MNNRIKVLKGKLTVVLFFISISLLLFYGVSKVPFHGDEASIISISRDYQKILNGNLEQVTYNQEGSTNQFLRLTTGTFVPITIFVTTKIFGIPTDSINNPWQWHQHENLDKKSLYDINYQSDNMPSTKVLMLSRYLLTLFVFLSVILLYDIVFFITKIRFISMLTSVLYISTPTILCDGRRAMQEGALLFFILLAILVVIKLVYKISKTEHLDKSYYWRYLFLGIVSGLSITTKHNASLVVFVFYLFLFWIINFKIKEKQNVSKLNILTIFSILIMSFLFFLLNPIWWTTNTILNLCFLALLLAVTSYLFIQKYYKQKSIIISLLVLSCLLLAYISIVPFIITYKTRVNLIEWQSQLTTDMNSYDVRAKKIVEELFFNKSQFNKPDKDFISLKQNNTNKGYLFKGRKPIFFWGILLILLTIFGIIKMIYHIFKNKNSEFLGFLIFFFIPLALIFLTNKLPWSRYYLIIQPQFYIIISISIKFIVDEIKKITLFQQLID